eukprot:TRINITY_DN9494_c0_g2_i1.p2 TRINITY_DN9494_c0_g2~~TRINITY_DN9494_c0_g2_i1.p2  ORF type:complete len:174 (+),score=45.50 TRINITY_DN9494_c0_g2_i1:311-832(+)
MANNAVLQNVDLLFKVCADDSFIGIRTLEVCTKDSKEVYELDMAETERQEKEIAKVEYVSQQKPEDASAPAEAAKQTSIPDMDVVKKGDHTPFSAAGVLTEAEIRDLFDKHDTAGAGVLQRDIVKSIYSSFENFGLDDSHSKVDEILGRYSRTANSTVTYDEFALLMLSLAQR